MRTERRHIWVPFQNAVLFYCTLYDIPQVTAPMQLHVT